MKINNIGWLKTICVLQMIIFIFFSYELFQLNILSLGSYCVLIITLLLVNLMLFLGNKKYRFSKIVTVVYCVLMIVFVLYMNKSIQTLNEITEVNNEVSKFSIIVLKDSDFQKVENLEGRKIQINTNYNAIEIGAMMNQLNELICCNYCSEADFINMATNLYNRDVDAILINEAYLWVLEHKYEDFVEDTRVIWNYEYKTKREDIKKMAEVENDCFNVFISGIDAEGDVSTVSRSDVNMLATVNMATNQILLTSIPRDYYVYISELKAKDKLTHAGLMGINSSVSTLEDLLNIDINYYVKVNFTTLIMMVDALGGIEIYSPYRIGKPGGANYFESGTLLLNGERALRFCRERYDLPNGDEDRIKNQQRVIQGMLNKLISPAIIPNYMDILDSVAGSFETNMSSKEITDLLKEQLKTMKPWDIQSYSLTGNGDYFKGGAMMQDTELYYCVPNEKSVQKATYYINSMIDGEFIIVE